MANGDVRFSMLFEKPENKGLLWYVVLRSTFFHSNSSVAIKHGAGVIDMHI